jgi:hypothetical protein
VRSRRRRRTEFRKNSAGSPHAMHRSTDARTALLESVRCPSAGRLLQGIGRPC